VINLKASSGTRLVDTEKEVAKLERLIREAVNPQDIGMIVSNIGVDPGFSAVYTSNSAMHTAFVQASLKPGHSIGSYEYIARVKRRMERQMPELTAFFSSGSLVDSVVNMGMPPQLISRSPAWIFKTISAQRLIFPNASGVCGTWPMYTSRRISITQRFD
jgi:hypothetical protein